MDDHRPFSALFNVARKPVGSNHHNRPHDRRRTLAGQAVGPLPNGMLPQLEGRRRAPSRTRGLEGSAEPYLRTPGLGTGIGWSYSYITDDRGVLFRPDKDSCAVAGGAAEHCTAKSQKANERFVVEILFLYGTAGHNFRVIVHCKLCNRGNRLCVPVRAGNARQQRGFA